MQPGASSDGAFPALQEVLSTFPTEEEIVAVKLVLPALYEVLLATDYLQADKEPTLGQVLPWLGRLRLRLARLPMVVLRRECVGLFCSVSVFW